MIYVKHLFLYVFVVFFLLNKTKQNKNVWHAFAISGINL